MQGNVLAGAPCWATSLLAARVSSVSHEVGSLVSGTEETPTFLLRGAGSGFEFEDDTAFKFNTDFLRAVKSTDNSRIGRNR